MKKSLCYFFVLLALVLVLQTAQSASSGGQSANQRTLSLPSPAQDRNRAVEADLDFGRMPLYFIANKGQMDKQVAYYVQGNDKTIYFTSEGLTIALAAPGESGLSGSKGSMTGEDSKGAAGKGENLLELGLGREGEKTRGSLESWVVKLDFVGAEQDDSAPVEVLCGLPPSVHTATGPF